MPIPSLSETQIQETINAEIANIYATASQSVAIAQSQTAAIPFTIEAGTAQALTLTATNASPTPSPDYPKTAEAAVTLTEIARATQAALDKTLTATYWTLTYTPSNTPTSTPTATHTPTSTATNTLTPTLDPENAAMQKAEQGVSSNGEWVPYIKDFDGVEMVLVPAGCFMMGSNTYDDEKPIHEICFDEPFWIDRYEVTNEQYGSVAAESYCTDRSSDPDQPRICINWFDARAYCEGRGGRLPTEAEWEYAARGPDAWVYPWGDDFEADNVVYEGNSGSHTWAVGSKPDGVSWVGALDMSGNVWEWTSSLYQSYPYQVDDGRKDIDNINNSRMIRGGSWNGFDYFSRAANRNRYNPSVEVNLVGFRCLLSH